MVYDDVCLVALARVMIIIVMVYYVVLCHVISYVIMWLCHVYDIDNLWCINLPTSCHVSYVKYERFEKNYVYMFHRLVMLWTIGGLTCIINLYCDVSYRNLMHFCVLYASGYFPVMINTDPYLTIFMFSMILCKPFPFVMSESMAALA